ncbi:uncharacterized protein LOC134282887 isoform X2 [Saccostrea cucullata]|uniref:uncharacterized protein LOC134282887 isoform X2 n=1 Tax=Saccostrea cuccullata TaxID=36930 RepID=UPI002ED060DE
MPSLYLFSKCVLLIFCSLFGEVITDESDPSDIVIIEELESETEIQKAGEMPSALGFNVRLVHGESPVHLKLKRNSIGYEKQKMVSIRQNATTGEIYFKEENIPPLKNVALYQDNETQAAFTVTCGEDSEGHCILIGSLNVNGEEYDITPMEKNPGTRRKKRHARRYGEPRQSRNSLFGEYNNPYAQANNNNIVHSRISNNNRAQPTQNAHYNRHVQTHKVHHNHYIQSNQPIRETIQQEFNPFATNQIDHDLEKRLLEYPGEPVVGAATGDFQGNEIYPPNPPPKRRQLYAAFRKDPKKKIKGDCVGRNSLLENVPFQTLARREKQREATFLQGGFNQQVGQHNRDKTREAFRSFSGSASDYYLTLVVVVDYSIYMRFYNASTETNVRARDRDAKSKIRMYFAHIVNGIDLRYENIRDPTFAIKVTVTEYVIADHPNFSPWTNTYVNPEYKYVAVWDALNRLVDWRETMIKHLPEHDHLMLFTGEDLYETRSDDPTVTGYAHVRTVCTKKSASINEDHGGFGGIITATHELAHSLGANHDGEQNHCRPEDQFIMTAMGGDTNQATKLNPWKFSECSVEYFRDYIQELNNKGENCMLERPMDIDPNFREAIKDMPGQILGPNEQCKEKLGQGSYYGWAGGLGRYQDICTNMACKNPKKKVSFHLYNAARGTSCGNKKWCINGECVFDRKAPKKDEKCVHGDSLKPFPNNATCSELINGRPSRCYTKEYREFCCESCSKKFTGKKRCEYGDKIASCVLVKSRPYLCYDNKNSQLCCIGCAGLHTGIQGCEYGDRKSGCDKRLCHTRDHQLNCCGTCGKGNPTTKSTTVHSQPSPIPTRPELRPTPRHITRERTQPEPTRQTVNFRPAQHVNRHSILPTTTHMIPFSSTRFSLKIGGNRQEGVPSQNKQEGFGGAPQDIVPTEDLIPDPFAPGFCVKKNAFYRPDVPCEFLSKWLSLCTETRFKSACCQTCNIDRSKNVKTGCVDSQFCTARTGADCYKKATRDNCCATCSKFETGFMLCPYGDKDARCGLMMRLNKKFYCENYGSTCCESCFKLSRRQEVTTPFPVVMSARRPDTTASRSRSQTQSRSEPRAAASRSATSSTNNLERN